MKSEKICPKSFSKDAASRPSEVVNRIKEQMVAGIQPMEIPELGGRVYIHPPTAGLTRAVQEAETLVDVVYAGIAYRVHDEAGRRLFSMADVKELGAVYGVDELSRIAEMIAHARATPGAVGESFAAL